MVEYSDGGIVVIRGINRCRVRSNLRSILVQNVIGKRARRWLQVIVYARKKLDPVVPQVRDIERGLVVDLLLQSKICLLRVGSRQVRIGERHVARATRETRGLQQ